MGSTNSSVSRAEESCLQMVVQIHIVLQKSIEFHIAICNMMTVLQNNTKGKWLTGSQRLYLKLYTN